MSFTVYGQPHDPNYCDLHPETKVGPYEVCQRCENAIYEQERLEDRWSEWKDDDDAES